MGSWVEGNICTIHSSSWRGVGSVWWAVCISSLPAFVGVSVVASWSLMSVDCGFSCGVMGVAELSEELDGEPKEIGGECELESGGTLSVRGRCGMETEDESWSGGCACK